MIRKMHGQDSVIDLEYVASKGTPDDEIYMYLEKKYCLNQQNVPMFKSTFGEPEAPRLPKSLSIVSQKTIRDETEKFIPPVEKTLEQAKEELRRIGGKVNKDDTIEDINARIAELKALA